MRKKMIAVLFLCVLFGACGGKVYRSYVYSFAGIENVKVNVELKNGYDLKNTLFDCYVTKDNKEILLIGLGDSSDLHDAQTLISAGKEEELENELKTIYGEDGPRVFRTILPGILADFTKLARWACPVSVLTRLLPRRMCRTA